MIGNYAKNIILVELKKYNFLSENNKKIMNEINPNIEIDVFQAAIDTWGENSQVSMAIEEMAELIVELNKYFFRNNKKRREKLIEEMADVELMLAQIRKIINADSEIDYWRIFKTQRLIKRINKYEKKNSQTKDEGN